MKPENRNKLFECWAWCDWKDKSTEFMLTYMAEVIPSWDESDVADWISKQSNEARSDWYKRNPDWFEKHN